MKNEKDGSNWDIHHLFEDGKYLILFEIQIDNGKERKFELEILHFDEEVLTMNRMELYLDTTDVMMESSPLSKVLKRS